MVGAPAVAEKRAKPVNIIGEDKVLYIGEGCRAEGVGGLQQVNVLTYGAQNEAYKCG